MPMTARGLWRQLVALIRELLQLCKWLLLTLAVMLTGLGVLNHIPRTFAGPTSPGGLQVEVSVVDWCRGWSADFDTAVEVTDPDGQVVGFWESPSGLGSWRAVESLRSSLRWHSPTDLHFSDGARDRPIIIRVSP